MNDTAVPAVEELALTADDDRSLFYVVSKRKFTILFLSTLGMYSVYWFYKNWDQFKDNVPYASEFGTTIWPVPRALFSVFFVHSLFRKVKESASDNEQVARWSNTAHAWLLVVLLLVSNGLDKASAKSMGSPTTDLLSLLILAPLLFSFLKAQEMVNLACGDAQGAANDKLTKANWVWIVIGALIWIGTLHGLMPAQESAQTGFSSSSSW